MPQDVGYAQVNAYQTIGIEFTYRFWNQYDPESYATRTRNGWKLGIL